MCTSVRLPVRDIMFPTNHPPFWTTEELLPVLKDFGFQFFESDKDKDEELQCVQIPFGWYVEGDMLSNHWRILDTVGRIRIRVVRKVPWGEWGEVGYIHLMFIEPAFEGALNPREGWDVA